MKGVEEDVEEEEKVVGYEDISIAAS